jgi:hypothetical protein
MKKNGILSQKSIIELVIIGLLTLLPIWISLYGQQINFYGGRLDLNSEFKQKINSLTAIVLSYLLACGFFLLWVLALQQTLDSIVKIK